MAFAVLTASKKPFRRREKLFTPNHSRFNEDNPLKGVYMQQRVTLTNPILYTIFIPSSPHTVPGPSQTCGKVGMHFIELKL